MSARQQNPFLVGKVAVRVVIVSGPAGTPALFTAAETARVQAITVMALRILGVQATAMDTRVPLVWDLRFTSVQVTAPPPAPLPDPNSHDRAVIIAREQPWRDEALQILTGQTDAAGMRALRADSLGANDHAVIVLWTRYECGWVATAVDEFAYCALSWPMFDARTGFRLNSAPLVLAHEICHLFGAPDEYSATDSTGVVVPCRLLDDQGEGFGRLDFANINCDHFNPHPEPCLMNSKDNLLCDTTKAHVGWLDSDRNGVLDVFA
ncbi:hypothetical protein J2Z21_009046 [Streptomyces griseochromogenes]|uniref:Uncharacterized protein n=1 Tax=Streptomyces griseochromogenes TaxID=68214 RepID=M1GNT6_9ACTN|nr:hypothetical protein [Streptomyces griseochromogenes]AGE35599.1 hypothetical protein EX-BLS-1 [Streptomyces griseochromogenes]ANP51568.1 hypothetical protein AVL59_19925 [Streptomyces griseochromogenes]MBP2056029.1 hypothetical protein [Streptomyces griseochromogenes]